MSYWHLVENSGRLVSKDELFAAVWPNLAITDDALVQSIGELRRALADDGPRLIRTVPRRGYRFESAVSASDPAASSDATQSPGSAIGVGASTLLATALTGWHRGLFAVGAIAALLAAGVLWTTPQSGDQRTKGAEAGTKGAIAILPFLNQSDDAAREYFADDLTQDIINALGRFSALTVMSWNAVLPCKGNSASPGEIARGLAVRYQVEGSVRHTGDRVRVIAQLVDTDGRVLWSARFDAGKGWIAAEGWRTGQQPAYHPLSRRRASQ